MNVFLCPASAAALYRGLPPECHPSSAAVLKLYYRDTHSFLGLAYVLHPLHDSASLQNGRTGSVARINRSLYGYNLAVEFFYGAILVLRFIDFIRNIIQNFI